MWLSRTIHCFSHMATDTLPEMLMLIFFSSGSRAETLKKKRRQRRKNVTTPLEYQIHASDNDEKFWII